MNKYCTKCGETKPLDAFSKDKTRHDGLRPYCKECDKIYYLRMGRERVKNWIKQNPEKAKASRKKGYIKNHEKILQRAKEKRTKLKLEAYNAYGGAICACCGETNFGFLTIDHINGVTSKERKTQMSHGWNICYWLKNQGYPSGFQVLCFNCNLGRAMNNGICPHKTAV